MAEINEESLVGEWKLDRFEVEKAPGDWTSWGKSVRGLLTYTPAGYVFVGINRNAGKSDFSAKSDSLFCSGTYRLQGDVVMHDISVASGSDGVGNELRGAVATGGNHLEISGASEKGERYKFTWSRAV